MVSMAVTWGRLIPKEISAFGITVSDVERQSLYFLLFLVVLYFSCSFLLYAVPEYRHWRMREQLFRDKVAAFFAPLAQRIKAIKATDVDNATVIATAKASQQAAAISGILAGVRPRAAFEFTVPIIAALVAMTFLLSAVAELPFGRVAVAVALVAGGVVVACSVRWARKRWKAKAPIRAIRRMTADFEELANKGRQLASMPDGPAKEDLKREINEDFDALQERYKRRGP